MTKKATIQPNSWYSLQDIVREKMIPWASSFSTIRRIVETDGANKNILKATISGEGRGKKYLFKGSNIINFITAVEAGKAGL